jgi:hypothetical protein
MTHIVLESRLSPDHVELLLPKRLSLMIDEVDEKTRSFKVVDAEGSANSYLKREWTLRRRGHVKIVLLHKTGD